MNSLAKRLDILEQRLGPRGCPAPDHGDWAPSVIRAGEPDPMIARCAGCGAERPIVLLQLVVVEPEPIVIGDPDGRTNGTRWADEHA